MDKKENSVVVYMSKTNELYYFSKEYIDLAMDDIAKTICLIKPDLKADDIEEEEIVGLLVCVTYDKYTHMLHKMDEIDLIKSPEFAIEQFPNADIYLVGFDLPKEKVLH